MSGEFPFHPRGGVGPTFGGQRKGCWRNKGTIPSPIKSLLRHASGVLVVGKKVCLRVDTGSRGTPTPCMVVVVFYFHKILGGKKEGVPSAVRCALIPRASFLGVISSVSVYSLNRLGAEGGVGWRNGGW